ncbi:MAG: TetR/AcrR family transcriptional regulator [Lachnospiraceae bacterium]|nr:TetR/AcrR family transcriptional regulator [Lachnospiraceae bacterium]
MSTNKKNELILTTYELLKQMSPDDIKIRTIAAEANCTSTVIYKHFDDLDHLILFASVRFLEDYIVTLQEVINQNSDALDMLIEMWRAFARHAFENAEVFELLFWGKYKERLGDTIFEYYQLFPDEWRNMDGLFTSVFFNNEIQERNSMIMHRAAATGYFSYDEARMLSDMECDMFHGLLMRYRDKYRLPGKAEEGAALFMDMLNSLIGHYRIK